MFTLHDIPIRNVGYEIIAAVITGKDEAAVIGKNTTKTGALYVCWSYKVGGGFCYGNYTNSFQDAVMHLQRKTVFLSTKREDAAD